MGENEKGRYLHSPRGPQDDALRLHKPEMELEVYAYTYNMYIYIYIYR